MNIETIIIILVVAGAAIYAGRDLYKSSRGTDSHCGDGCSSCPMADMNKPSGNGNVTCHTDEKGPK